MNDHPKPKFTLANGIAREAQGLFKDASLVPALKQAQLEIQLFLKDHLDDHNGCLRAILLRRVQQNDLLLASHLDRPVEALQAMVQKLLEQDSLLVDLVREVDQYYGELYLERPLFQRPGQAAHPDDPYTHQSVRQQLLSLSQTF